MIETALTERGRDGATSRVANYRRGVARMIFADGRGSVLVRNFTLADGQHCVRVELQCAASKGFAETCLYPETPGFDWATALAEVARLWTSIQRAGEGIDGKIASMPQAEAALA